jgi:hypothetical protein
MPVMAAGALARPLENAMNALSQPADVAALADELSAAADAIHARVLADLATHAGAPVPEADQAAMRALFDAEVLLRQRANGLYADAAAAVVKSLALPQQQLMALAAEARTKIRTITRISDALSLSGALLTVAGAAVTGQLPVMVTAVERLRRTVLAVQAHR